MRINLSSKQLLSLLGLSFGLCSACSGGSSNEGSPGAGTPSQFSSSVPADKPVGSLTDSESAQLCREFDAYFSSKAFLDPAKEFACRFSGLFLAALSAPKTDADARAACKMTYDACVSAPAQSEPPTCKKPSAACSATVAELSTCFSDSAKAEASAANSLPLCSTLTVADLQASTGSGAAASSPPASCAAVQQKCPDAPQAPTGSAAQP